MKELFYSLIFAIQFLTRIPLAHKRAPEHIVIRRALALFPLVGFLIGGMLYILWRLLASLAQFNPYTIALIIVTGDVMITGAFHLDGLADTFDAFLSSQTTREQKLAIMKDSRIGVMGATALIISLLLKTALVGETLQRGLPSALLVYPALGRWAQVFFLYASPYVRESGTAHMFAQSVDGKTLARASLWLIPCLFFPSFYLIFLLFLGALFLYRSYVHRKIGGITGDILGSASVISEIVVLFSISVCAG